jgi:hypothetical protein
MVPGYSKKPLADKLGIQPGFRISMEGNPDHYMSLLGTLPEGVDILSQRATKLDFLHLFATNRLQLEDRFPRARKRIKPDGMIWVSWPKLRSPLKGRLNENVVREIGLANGLVDVKVAAIDENWSGLKFVFRIKDRPQ